MRTGCLGCLVLLALVLGLGLTVWGVARALDSPGVPTGAAGNAADGVRAQQKLYEIVRRAHGGRQGDRVALTEREINALLSRHVQEGTLPLDHPTVRLVGGGLADIAGQVRLEQLLAELRRVTAMAPASWRERPVWVRIEGRPHIDTGAGRTQRYLKIDVERAWMGRQRVPTMLLKIMLSPTHLRTLSWPVPAGIDAVTVEPGRLVVTVASAR